MNRDDEDAALAQQQQLEQQRLSEDEQLASDPGYSLFLAEVAAMNAIEQLLKLKEPKQ